jgi:hypothetical protein
MTHADKVPLLDCSRARLFRWSRFVQVGMEEAGSGHEDSSHNILTLDALQVLSGPGNP